MAKRAAGIPIALRGIVIGPALGGVAVGFAAAAECPITSTSNRVEALLDAAPTCAAAADLFWACGLGGGRDVIRAEVVRQRCDRNAPKLNARELRAYDVALKRCWDGVEPLRRMGGTMYRSPAAYCEVTVYDKVLGPPGARLSVRGPRARAWRRPPLTPPPRLHNLTLRHCRRSTGEDR
jgi:hypothetical protein